MKKLIVAPESWKHPENHIKLLLGHPWYKILANLYKTIFESTHAFYKGRGIYPTLFPITTGSISSPMGLGSDSIPVSVEIKGNKIYLADSMQFCLEIGARISDTGAYYIMPTFRGEEMDERHLNEFVHSEVEIPGNMDDIRNLAEDYIKYMVASIIKNNAEDISLVTGDINHLKDMIDRKIPKISYPDAVSELKRIDNALVCLNNDLYNITKTGEKYLLEKYGDFTWLTDIPWALVPFYQAKQADGKSAYASDLLAGIGEILGCGQRVLSVKDLDESLKSHNVNPSEYEWYREMRKIKEIQTSGFGLGIERFILWVLKHDDIRDCTLLLRDHNKITTP